MEENIKKFEVDDEKFNEIVDTITDRLCFEKVPAENPIAFVVGGQPGAGKTGLIGKTLAEFENAIVLDVDDYRYFHPNILEIFKDYPDQLVPLTKEFVNKITKIVVDRLIVKKYNLIIHKTLKDEEIIGDTLEPLRENGYAIVLRIMAVSEVESRTSALERSLAFKTNVGWCRWVTENNHKYAYAGIPTTAKGIFDKGYADAVQVFGRGFVPTQSVLKYSLSSEEGKKNLEKLDADKNIFADFEIEKYADPETAINGVRDEETERVLPEVFYRLEVLKLQISDKTDEKYISEVENMVKNYLNEHLKKEPYMNNNTKLELAKEVMARMIAIAASDGFDQNNEHLMNLLEEEKLMNNFDEKTINKIIKEYSPLVKNEED